MKAETRFPRTVEAYKAHLHEDRPHYDSFQTFCRKQGVGYKGVMQWMHRHNRSVGSLRLEVLLEKNGNDSNLKSSLIECMRPTRIIGIFRMVYDSDRYFLIFYLPVQNNPSRTFSPNIVTGISFFILIDSGNVGFKVSI